MKACFNNTGTLVIEPEGVLEALALLQWQENSMNFMHHHRAHALPYWRFKAFKINIPQISEATQEGRKRLCV